MTIQHHDKASIGTFSENLVGVDGATSSDEPRSLPYVAYPRARDAARHGLQPLPDSLPLIDFAGAQPYRSARYATAVATDLTPSQLLQMAWVIGASFARREPQARHLRPPKHPPAGLMEVRHSDPFGTDSFGPWGDTATHLYWLARLFALTDPTSPADAIEVNEETLAQSVAILDAEEQVIGSAFNETMPPFDVEPPLREGDPVPRRRRVGVGAGLRRVGRSGRGGTAGPLRKVSGVPGGVWRGQGQPPSPYSPLRRSPERGHLRARGGECGETPGARLLVHGHRSYQPVDRGGLRGSGWGARALRPVPDRASRSSERRAARGCYYEPERLSLG